MRIGIHHETHYRYQQPVNGLIQTLRLTPRNNDALLFDVAVTVNDWCSTPDGGLDGARAAALLDAYHAERPFTDAERAAWPAMLRAAALRFWMSRAADFHLPRTGEMVLVKDPTEYRDILRLRIATVPPLPR